MNRMDRLPVVIVFIGGMTVMTVEMAGARLLDPYFGNSLIVWACLIGLIMLYLAVGYFLGGRLADRWPDAGLLYRVTLWASFSIALIPLVAPSILRFAAAGMAGYQAGLLIGSLLGVLALFSVPIILLGIVSPFVIRLSMREVIKAGDISGRIYALSTIGSLLGTFLPVLLLIPNLGTRATFFLAAAWLFIPSLAGILSRSSLRGSGFLLMPAVITGLAVWQGMQPIKAAENLLFETESAYNYIQVLDIDGVISLKLNEGEGVHSVFHPQETLTYATWDYFLIAPFFNAPPFPPERVESLCMIGLAAGTIPKLYTLAYGPISIDGAEIDPEIIEVGRRFFDMTEPNLHAYSMDGRLFLRTSQARYDVIAVDAYRPPYIPFHLTTREFFEETRRKLTQEGVVVINVVRTVDDHRLVDALASTMRTVFPSVYVLDEPLFGHDLGNSLVIATARETSLDNFGRNIPLLAGWPLLEEVALRSLPYLSEAEGVGLVFTDDRAPVEQVVHSLILRYAIQVQ